MRIEFRIIEFVDAGDSGVEIYIRVRREMLGHVQGEPGNRDNHNSSIVG